VIVFEWISENNIVSLYQILYGAMRILRDPEHISQHEDERAGPFAFYGVTYQIQPSVCCQNLILFVLEEGERNNTYRSTDEVISLKHTTYFCCIFMLLFDIHIQNNGKRRVVNIMYTVLLKQLIALYFSSTTEWFLCNWNTALTPSVRAGYQ
jgi:hypothetical protein